MSNYSETLRDPRWQKKRLKIMERDDFTCQVCKHGIYDGTPLHVHHIKYIEGKNPWDYADNYLITLCEECHSKVHNDEIKLKVLRENSKPSTMIFYRSLFLEKEGLGASEAIIYSVLLGHSILKIGLNNYKNTSTCNSIKDVNIDNMANGEEEYIPLEYMSISKLAEKVEMTRPAVRKILADLKTKGAIKDGFIRCPLKILEKGFMKLPPKTKLKGSQLTFYALLLERSRRYNGTIDTWASRLAKLAGITKTNAQSIINILEKKGFLKRLENGKLLVL